MPDSNLNTSISAMRTAILNDLPTATVAELVDLSRAAKSLNLANDSTVETAINDRAVALINGGATQAEIIKISQAVKSVLSPATFANNIANITTITSSLIPDTDVSYDLGTSSNRFNDIYLDGNTIDLGGQTIKSTATGIEVPEITIGSGTNKVKLSANSSGKLEQVGTNSGGVVQDAVTGSGPASTAVTNLSDLTAISSPATGQSVLVTSTNKLYIYNGTGWYLIAEVTNLSPTAITGLNATYNLATDGTATTITLNSTDPEGATLTWSHAVTTGTLGSTATITNVDNVFTITPSTTEADGGSFSVTFSASDGSQAATSVSAFTLAFLSEDVRLNISSTFPGPTYPNEVPANHAVSGQYLELTQTMSNNTRYGNIDFGPDNFEEVWVEVKGGNGGISLDTAGYASGGSGSRIRASLDLTAIHTAYGHKKINFSVGQTGGARASLPGNGSGGGASAIWVWSNSDGTSGTAIPLIVAAGGGGGSTGGNPAIHVQGKDAFLPSSNMTTIQLFSHFSGFHSTIDVNSRPWQDVGPPSTGSGNGASWSEIGLGQANYAPNVYSIRDQFSLNNNPPASNANTVGANSPTFGGGNSGMYGGGGGGVYFGGFRGHYNPSLGAMGGQSYIDTSYVTLINHIVIALAPEIKIHKVNSSW